MINRKAYPIRMVGKAVSAVTFILLFAFIIAILYIHPYSKSKDGFTDFFHFNFGSMNEGTPPGFNSKNAVLPVKQPYYPQLAEAGVGNIDPSPPPASALPSAPFGSQSKGVPQPYKNPDTEPAKYIRILAVKEDLQAFFGFQASSLTDSSDPSIQIPLTRARADVSELVDVQSVLERNPGLPSRITNKQLNDIQANLRYLQTMLRDLEVSGAVAKGSSEGFQDLPQHAPQPDGPPATMAQLTDFSQKVKAETMRLSASGTSDPVVVARINTLTRIQADVDQTIAELKSGIITPETVPIYESDIKKALPVLGNPTDPLPTVLKQFNLPPAIANLFPGGLSPSNKEQAAQINNVVKGYMSQIFEGTSWGVDVDVKANVKYDSPRAALIGLGGMKVYDAHTTEDKSTQGIPGVKANIDSPILEDLYVDDGVQHDDPKKNSLAYALPGGHNTYDNGLPGLTHDRTFPAPKVGGLDWKERAKQIKKQVKKRGLDPSVFGAIPDNADVSNEFNWRGYTQMFCTRLAANTDPGLPVTVGCPPQEWRGWNV